MKKPNLVCRTDEARPWGRRRARAKHRCRRLGQLLLQEANREYWGPLFGADEWMERKYFRCKSGDLSTAHGCTDRGRKIREKSETHLEVLRQERDWSIQKQDSRLPQHSDAKRARWKKGGLRGAISGTCALCLHSLVT